MQAIIVEDEVIMIKKFLRLSKEIPDLNVIGTFENGENAVYFAKHNQVDVAFLDVSMPVINGIETAKLLRKIREDIVIVFISAYDQYIREFNQIGGDYYIVKPYNLTILEMAMKRIRLVLERQKKSIYIQTFGRFTVFKDGEPINLIGKAKEILALVVARRGKEISNEEIFSTIWENREYSNEKMTVYYNALRRLKKALKEANLEALLISTTRGQIINTAIFDCDYYKLMDTPNQITRFENDFLCEYSWAEYILANILNYIN